MCVSTREMLGCVYLHVKCWHVCVRTAGVGGLQGETEWADNAGSNRLSDALYIIRDYWALGRCLSSLLSASPAAVPARRLTASPSVLRPKGV